MNNCYLNNLKLVGFLCLMNFFIFFIGGNNSASAQTVTFTANINWPAYSNENQFRIVGPATTGYICNPSRCYTTYNATYNAYSATGVAVGSMAASCISTYQIQMMDRSGDGWDNSGTITLFANGVNVGTYACGGGSTNTNFTLPTAVLEAIAWGSEGAGVSSAASGCGTATLNLGSGASRQLTLAANTSYIFSWTNSPATSGFTATVASGGAGATSSSFSSDQTAWFSGTTAPAINFQALRNSCTWSTTSAVMTYRHATPTVTLSSGAGTNNQTRCINTAMAAITFATTNVVNSAPSSVTVSGLPAGVSGSWSGNVFTISGTPSAAGSFPYTVTASNNGCTATATGTITVVAASTAPTGISGGGVTVCPGNTVTLTATGGSLSAGASYVWTNTCGGAAATGTLSGAGNVNLTVSPTVTTTYFVRAGAGTTCPASACSPSSTITLPSTAGGLATSGQSATCNVSGSNRIHFYNGGNLIVSINPNGNNLGSVTATAIVAGSAVMTQACNTGSNPSFTTAALGRTWVITPTNNLAASVRFPFTSGELSSLVTASGTTTSNALDNVSGIGDLKISRYSGVNQDGSWANNCVSAGGSGGTVLGSASGSGATTTGNGFPATVASSSYIQFNTPGFSEFWLHGSGSSPLPVELTVFTATCNDESKVDINWSTESEINSQSFIVEKSRDLNTWDFVATHNASGNSNYKIDYIITDNDPYSGISYYRLVQVDNDGAEKIYGPMSVSCTNSKNAMIVFPNPTKGGFTVEISSSENLTNVEVQLTDLTGKVISSRNLNLVEGKNQILFEESGLRMGTYLVKLISASEFKPVKVIVN